MQSSEFRSMPTSKESLTVYLEEDMKRKLQEIAKQERRSMAFMAEQFILEGIAAWERKQAEQKDEQSDDHE
jgi:predicted transcriptional regulator